MYVGVGVCVLVYAFVCVRMCVNVYVWVCVCVNVPDAVLNHDVTAYWIVHHQEVPSIPAVTLS